MFKFFKLLFLNYRQMTYQEGISYLKPFIFKVHPDFFEQQPKAKEINQTSLKLLYNYLHSLDNKYDKVISLQFYVRQIENKSKLSVINICLKERNIHNAISQILTSCQAFANIDDIPRKKYVEDMTYKFDFNPKCYSRTVENNINIVEWLKTSINNEIKAREKSVILRNKINEITSIITTEFDVSSVIWRSNYNYNKQYNAIVSLYRVLKNLNLSLSLNNIIYTSDEKSGINCYGDMLLSCQQVEDTWSKEFLNIHRNYQFLSDIKLLETDISNQLQNSKVHLLNDFHKTCLASEYIRSLKKIQFTLSLIRPDKFNRINSGYEYAISDLTNNPFIHSSGIIIIPANAESRSLITYLDRNLIQQINSTKTEHNNNVSLFKRLKNVFITDFNCKEVILNVSIVNGITALKKLLSQLRSNYLTLNFDNCDLIIDQYYGTTTDGDVIIPWNFI